MDFNTGTSSGRPSRRPSGGEFDYSDPLRSFVNTLPRVLFSPRTFFRGISHRRGVANPLLFAAICTLIAAVLNGIFNELAQAVSGLRFLATEEGMLTYVASDFIIGMVLLVIITGIYHLFVRLLVGANNAGLEGTFRVVSYGHAVQVLGWVPLINLLAAVYALYLFAFGFQEVHSTTYKRAAAIAALPIVLSIPIAFLFTIFAISVLL
jgi:hypothetical protein